MNFLFWRSINNFMIYKGTGAPKSHQRLTHIQSGNVGLAYFFFAGAINNTAVTRAYKTYRTQVIVLFQGKLISGWFNANTTNAIAITTITKPIILEIFLFIQSQPFVKFKFFD